MIDMDAEIMDYLRENEDDPQNRLKNLHLVDNFHWGSDIASPELTEIYTEMEKSPSSPDGEVVNPVKPETDDDLVHVIGNSAPVTMATSVHISDWSSRATPPQSQEPELATPCLQIIKDQTSSKTLQKSTNMASSRDDSFILSSDEFDPAVDNRMLLGDLPFQSYADDILSSALLSGSGPVGNAVESVPTGTAVSDAPYSQEVQLTDLKTTTIETIQQNVASTSSATENHVIDPNNFSQFLRATASLAPGGNISFPSLRSGDQMPTMTSVADDTPESAAAIDDTLSKAILEMVTNGSLVLATLDSGTGAHVPDMTSEAEDTQGTPAANDDPLPQDILELLATGVSVPATADNLYEGTESLDPEVREAAREAINTRSDMPLIKQALRNQIQIKHLKSGKKELGPLFENKPPTEPTPEELEKIENRKRKNQESANQSRKNRQKRVRELEKYIEKTEPEVKKLKEEIQKQKEVKRIMEDLVRARNISQPSLLERFAYFGHNTKSK